MVVYSNELHFFQLTGCSLSCEICYKCHVRLLKIDLFCVYMHRSLNNRYPNKLDVLRYAVSVNADAKLSKTQPIKKRR